MGREPKSKEKEEKDPERWREAPLEIPIGSTMRDKETGNTLWFDGERWVPSR